MARTKQPAVKRESSSEYFNKQTASWEGSDEKQVANSSNGKLAAKVKPVVAEAKEAGILQLVIAVSGIYASL
jgi:UDP-galactose transporter B1